MPLQAGLDHLISIAPRWFTTETASGRSRPGDHELSSRVLGRVQSGRSRSGRAALGSTVMAACRGTELSGVSSIE